MIKNPCYVYWDDDSVAEAERRIYIQCGLCFEKNKKGFRWPTDQLRGENLIKCHSCDTIIYEKKNRKNNE